MAIKTLQLLRNAEVFKAQVDPNKSAHDVAKDALKTKLASAKDGEVILARYEDGSDVRTLLGVAYKPTEGSNKYEIFDNQGGNDAITDAINALKNGASAGFDTLKEIEDVIKALNASSVADDNKIVTDVIQANGQITATASNITGVKLSGYTEGTDADIAATDTLGEALGKLQAQINAMDLTEVKAEGEVITAVSEQDGKVSASKTAIKDVKLTGYAKDTTKTGGIAATDDIEDALSKIENQIVANSITNDDGSITVTPGNGSTDIKVNIKSGEKVIKLGEDGIYTNLNLVKITTGLDETVKERYEFRDSDNNKIGEAIDIAKDSHIVSITYDETTQKLIYKYLDASGAEQTTQVDMSHLILETEVENGIQSKNGKLSIKLDDDGDDTGDGKFLTVGANGLKLDGVTDAITTAINALDAPDTAVAGQYVSSVSEADGKISVARLNVSDAVLNGYTKGTKPASTAIAATDNVKGAIAKLEHQIDDAKAAATTKVVEGTDAGNNLTISSANNTDGSVTYTIGLTDVASKAALDAEIAARKAVDGQSGQTYTKNTTATYINNATSLNDADVKLDAALKNVDDAMLTGVAKGNGIDVTTKSNKSQTISAVAVANDPIIQVTASGIGTKEDAVFNCGTY